MGISGPSEEPESRPGFAYRSPSVALTRVREQDIRTAVIMENDPEAKLIYEEGKYSVETSDGKWPISAAGMARVVCEKSRTINDLLEVENDLHDQNRENQSTISHLTESNEELSKRVMATRATLQAFKEGQARLDDSN